MEVAEQLDDVIWESWQPHSDCATASIEGDRLIAVRVHDDAVLRHTMEIAAAGAGGVRFDLVEMMVGGPFRLCLDRNDKAGRSADNEHVIEITAASVSRRQREAVVHVEVQTGGEVVQHASDLLLSGSAARPALWPLAPASERAESEAQESG